MKIATWNIERLKNKSKLAEIKSEIEAISPDILVLTESDNRLVISDYKYCISTPFIYQKEPQNYLKSEQRVTIYTNYEVINQFKTYDDYSSLCIELKTELGNLIVYGTIIGIYGNRHPNFNEDLISQLNDFNQLSLFNNLCIIGDYNLSFADNYYFTNFGRKTILDCFKSNNIDLITSNRAQCIDHIALSSAWVESKKLKLSEWNLDKNLSDHKGILALITMN